MIYFYQLYLVGFEEVETYDIVNNIATIRYDSRV